MSKVLDTSYRGNEQLRRYNSSYKYTPEQIKEIVKCQEDPVYFIENYIYIVNIDKGIIRFKLYDYQRDYIRMLHGDKRIIAKWPRQSGKTASTAAYMTWFVLFNEHKHVGVLAHQAGGAREILDRVQLMYEHLPVWLQAGIIYWQKGSFELDNGCKMSTYATDSPAARGKAFAILYLDEIGFVTASVFKDFYQSVYPTVASSKTAKIIMTSTPNGMNHFYKLWKEAVSGKNGFSYLEINWYDVPGRNQKWKEDTIAEFGNEHWLQEFEADFIGASGSLIKLEVLKSIPFGEILTKEFDDAFTIYEYPVEGRLYALLGDVAEGVGKDSSVLHVLDVTEIPYKQVAVFRSNTIKTDIFPEVIAKIGEMYNNALAIIEQNGIGDGVLNMLNYEVEYENIYFNGKGFFGIKMTKHSKRIGASELKFQIENRKLIIQDHETINEFSSFIRYPNGTYAAEKGKNDDHVTPFILFCFLCTNKLEFEKWFEKEDHLEINNNMISKIEQELLPIGWQNEGHGGVSLFDNNE